MLKFKRRINWEMSEQLKKRTKKFALDVIGLSAELPQIVETRHAISQLIRSSSSVAANYRSACRGKSKADFISKMGTVVEEADETLLWFELFEDAEVCAPDKVNKLKSEADELLRIFSTALGTAKHDTR